MSALVENPPNYDPDALQAAEDLVREFCGWHIAPSIAETLTVDGTGTCLLSLPSTYITAVNSVTSDGVTIPATGYRWSQNGIMERISGVWTWKRRGVAVNVEHGYTTAPAAVRRVVATLAAAAYATLPALTEGMQISLRPYELKAL